MQQHYLILWASLAFWELGQIWLCQIVVYPLFAKVGEADYVAYYRFYSRRIPLVVILPGFASFLMPVPLAMFGPAVPTWMNATNILCGVAGLLFTVLLAIPRYNRLEKGGKNAATIAELIFYNWLRTISITIQSIITVMMLAHGMKAG